MSVTNAILVHGWSSKAEYFDPTRPTPSNDHWFPWLSKQLVLRGVNVVAIEMPESYYPRYNVWKKELERYDINKDTMLVGFSCGGGFLVRWLSENDVKVGKVVLAAPWLGYDVDYASTDFAKDFFDFKIDKRFPSRTKSTHLIYSTDDMPAVLHSVDDLQSEVNALEIRQLSDKGHFTINSLGGEAFPELLEVLTS